VLAGEVEQASETERKMKSTAGLLNGWNKLSQGARERTRGRKGRGGGAAGERRKLGLQDTSGRLKREGHGAWQPSHRALRGRGTVLIASVQTKKKAKKRRVLRAGVWWASARKRGGLEGVGLKR
jgi:hypothetical protein